MKKVGVAKIALVLAIGTLPLLQCSLPADEAEKIPLTTSSSEALDLFLQGRDLAEKIRFQEALPYFQEAVEEDPNFAMAHLNLAFSQNTADGFFESIKRAAELADGASPGEQLWIRGTEAGINGRPTEQREYYKKLVDAYPNDERAHNLLGNQYFGQREYALAIAAYEKSIDIDSEFSQPYNQLGYSYRFSGKYEKAREAFEQYIEVLPDDPNPHDSYAELLMKMGEFETSVEHYKKALSINPQFIPSYIGIATNYNYMGKHEKARETLETMYEKSDNNGQRRQALFAAAVSYVDEGRIGEALEVLSKRYKLAKEGDDDAALAADLNQIGNILLEAGQPEKAIEKFEKSVILIRESDRSNGQKENAERQYVINGARVALRQNDLATAKSKLQEHRTQIAAIENHPQAGVSHQVAAMIALEEGDYETALAELEQTSQLNPYNVYREAMVYEAKGDTEKAKELFRKTAEFNALNNLNYAFIRAKAVERTNAT